MHERAPARVAPSLVQKSRSAAGRMPTTEQVSNHPKLADRHRDSDREPAAERVLGTGVVAHEGAHNHDRGRRRRGSSGGRGKRPDVAATRPSDGGTKEPTPRSSHSAGSASLPFSLARIARPSSGSPLRGRLRVHRRERGGEGEEPGAETGEVSFFDLGAGRSGRGPSWVRRCRSSPPEPASGPRSGSPSNGAMWTGPRCFHVRRVYVDGQVKLTGKTPSSVPRLVPLTGRVMAAIERCRHAWTRRCCSRR